MTKQDFLYNIRTWLRQWEEEPSECWKAVFRQPGATININGQTQTLQGEAIDAKIEVVGEAEVGGISGLQILFEVSKNNDKLLEYEEVLYYDDYSRFKQIYNSIF